MFSFPRTSPSLTPLPYIFWCRNPGGWGSLWFSEEPAKLTFPPGLSRPPREDALCKGCMGFSRTPRKTSRLLSLPLFSTLSFSRDRPTPGQRPFTIQPPSIHHEFSPDPVAQVSSDGTLTLRRKGPLGRDLGDAPPSFRVSLSLFLAEGLGDDLFSRPDSR